MAARLRKRLADQGTAAGHPSVIEAAAEELPFDDGSFDTVVATLVLCTVDDPPRAAAEARRVLVEGGGFSTWSTSQQLAAARLVAGPARATVGLLRRGLPPQSRNRSVARRRGLLDRSPGAGHPPEAPPLARPLIRGVAGGLPGPTTSRRPRRPLPHGRSSPPPTGSSASTCFVPIGGAYAAALAFGFAFAGFAFAKVSSPSAVSTSTVSPSANSPSSSRRASLSTSCFWITRFRGRAP